MSLLDSSADFRRFNTCAARIEFGVRVADVMPVLPAQQTWTKQGAGGDKGTKP